MVGSKERRLAVELAAKKMERRYRPAGTPISRYLPGTLCRAHLSSCRETRHEDRRPFATTTSNVLYEGFGGAGEDFSPISRLSRASSAFCRSLSSTNSNP